VRVVVIGGTGHIGTYLVPRLVGLGHDVVVLSRGQRAPYRDRGGWDRVTSVDVDRQAEDRDGGFGRRVAALRPDVVVDLICFTPESAGQLADALTGTGALLVHCGTIWVHGPSARVPTGEDSPRRPVTAYGQAKAAIEDDLLRRSRRGELRATVIHPGHISGPGWVPVNPAGNVNVDVFQRIADGEPVVLPDLGLATLQHVHADDVAGVFVAALGSPSVATGESFHAVGSGAVTMRGYAEAAGGWFGQESRLTFAPYAEWAETVTPEDARVTLDHLRHSPHCSMDKAARLLGFRPRYSALEAAEEAVRALVDKGLVASSRG
jgi:nucleoside-diphosphate-sugar epimerase